MDIQKINHALVSAIGRLQEGEIGQVMYLGEARKPKGDLLVAAVKALDSSIDIIRQRVPKLKLGDEGKKYAARLLKRFEEMRDGVSEMWKDLQELYAEKELTANDVFDLPSGGFWHAISNIEEIQKEIARGERHGSQDKFGKGAVQSDLYRPLKSFYQLNPKKIKAQGVRLQKALMKRTEPK